MVEKAQELQRRAAELEADNARCGERVAEIDREMLEEREKQRGWEQGYSDRMQEIRERITNGKRNYTPGRVDVRGEELRGERERLRGMIEELEKKEREDEEEEKEREEDQEEVVE